ncbi:MAG: hypothetical protein ABSG46_13350 [Candidatus Binataceae bacterium]
MLASAIGNVGSVPQNVVVNELTTVATGNAFAQFVGNWSIEGNPCGISNAIQMAANLADPQSGDAGIVLASLPYRRIRRPALKPVSTSSSAAYWY